MADVQAAVTDADAAVATGQKYAAMQVDVGLDAKALLEAWNAIQKQHPTLPVIMFSLHHAALLLLLLLPKNFQIALCRVSALLLLLLLLLKKFQIALCRVSALLLLLLKKFHRALCRVSVGPFPRFACT